MDGHGSAFCSTEYSNYLRRCSYHQLDNLWQTVGEVKRMRRVELLSRPIRSFADLYAAEDRLAQDKQLRSANMRMALIEAEYQDRYMGRNNFRK